MSKGSFSKMNCGLAQTLERVGDWWTLLILRNAFCGMTRSEELREHLGIASNVLSDRLRKLVKCGVMTRKRAPEDRRTVDYRLTERGLSLFPVLIAMTEWGERWVPDPRGPRVEFLEEATGDRIAGVQICSVAGHQLTPRDLRMVPGPGADQKMLDLLRCASSQPSDLAPDEPKEATAGHRVRPRQRHPRRSRTAVISLARTRKKISALRKEPSS